MTNEQLLSAIGNRQDYNLDLAAEALLRGDISEQQRFLSNATHMEDDYRDVQDNGHCEHIAAVYDGWED
jgi:hypothetical protein